MKTTRTNRIEFITTDYVAAHGKLPRGMGTWAFADVRDLRRGGDIRPEWIYTWTGTLAEAKHHARIHFILIANRHGRSTIDVAILS